MTERLYYDDAYTTHFSARILERLTLENRPAVILDQTYYYPTGGGQPFDTGTLNGVLVIEVLPREGDGEVIHVVSEPLSDDAVTGVVNWSRRFDHMQHHTGQHVLTQAFVQTADAKTVSFHLSPDSVTIDLESTNLSQEQLDAAEDLANRIVWENRPVNVYLRQPDDQEGVRVRKMPKQLYTDGLRIIDIEGFDVTACGGTHVAHTGEIGIIKIVRTERRGGKTRVEFRCGARALRDFREKTIVGNALTASLNCRLSETPDAINHLRDDLKTVQSALKTATGELLDYEAARLLSSANRTGSVAVIAAAYENRDPAEVKLLAGKLVESPGVTALLGIPGEKVMLFFARSENVPHDMGKLLKDMLAKLGGRGGGQPAFAQGGGVPLDREALQAALNTAQMMLHEM
jgi:alanyl-tRNA synthetase